MIIALKITLEDQTQAKRMLHLLPPNEKVLLATEEGVEIDAMAEWIRLPWTDDYNSFPQTDNHVFQQIALYCKDIIKAPFLYMTAQSVPTRATWFSEIKAAYVEAITKRKPFMGDLVRDEAQRVNTMSPVAVYPPNISSFAGEMMTAHFEHWSMEGGAQIGNWFQKTPLIRHLMDGAAHAIEQAALVSPDRDGRIFERIHGNSPLIITPPTEPFVSDLIQQHERPDVIDLTKIKPWEDKEASLTAIRTMCKELKRYCTIPKRIGAVRAELAAAGVVIPIQAYRKNKFARRKKRGPRSKVSESVALHTRALKLQRSKKLTYAEARTLAESEAT